MRESIAYDSDVIRKTINKYLKHKPDEVLAKGVATIQLFDSDQNLIREIKSENIITDRLPLGIYANFCKSAFGTDFGKTLSYDDNVFTTLILTSNDGPEEHLSVIKGKIVGYCMLDASYDTENDLSGFYNKKESKNERISKDGIFGPMHARFRWHMVFNFPDFAANGTFQTIYVADAKNTDEHTIIPFYSVANTLYPTKCIPYMTKSNDLFSGNIQKCGYDNGKFAILQKYDTTEQHDDESDDTKEIFNLYLHLLNAKTNKYTDYTIDPSWYTNAEQASEVAELIPYSDGSSCNVHIDGINDLVYISYDTYHTKINNFDCATEIIKIDLQNKHVSILDTSTDTNRFKGNSGMTDNDDKSGCSFYVRDSFLYNIGVKFDAEDSSERKMATLYILKYNNQGALEKAGSTVVDFKDYHGESMSLKSPLWLPTCCVSPFRIGDKIFCFDYDCEYIGEQNSKVLNPEINYYNDGTTTADAAYNEELGAFVGYNQYSVDNSNNIEMKVYYPVHPISHNRLPSPVTKTPANAMKIQYDLTYDCINPEIIVPSWYKQ